MDTEKIHINDNFTFPDALQLQDTIFRFITKASDTRGFQYVSTAILGFVVICVLNWLWTYQNRNKPSSGGGPPVVPHWIPWLGSAISFTKDFDRFDAWMQSIMPPHTPYTLVMGGQKIIYVNSPTLYTDAVKMSKQLVFDPVECIMVGQVLGMPKKDMERYEVGMNIGRVPNPPYDKLTEAEIKKIAMSPQFWKQYQDNMFGDSLVVLSDKILENFAGELDTTLPQPADSATARNNNEGNGNAWTTIDMVEFQKEILFKASVEALFGCWIKESRPEIWKDFWEYEDGFMQMCYEYPAFLCRKTLAARQKVLDATINWLKVCEKKAPNVSQDVVWEEYWGSRLARQRDETTRGGGISYTGRAAHHLGMMFALNGNTVPAVIWIIYYTLKTPGLLQRLLSELTESSALTYDPVTKLPIIDTARLSSLPLLYSVYKETLRLAISSITTRKVIEESELAGYKLAKGSMIIMPGRTLQCYPGNWTSSSEHAIDGFWAERFLEDEATDAKEKKKRDSCWRPFGAGKSYCVGRYMAAAEVMGGLAVMIGMFDMELVDAKHEPKIEPSRMGRGGMLPDSKIMIKIRRKQVD